jgi:hypothetical protein
MKKEITKKVHKVKAGDKRLGNSYWKKRSKSGRDKLFSTPEDLWDAACEYFQWCEDHPLYESKAFSFQGVITTATIPKMRAMTMKGLCLYLHCNEAYFRQFNEVSPNGGEDFSTVIREIEDVIYVQKFTGAAAGLLDANIIARELGLSDKQELTGKDGAPIVHQIIKWGNNEIKI